jgi:hypothetical protein
MGPAQRHAKLIGANFSPESLNKNKKTTIKGQSIRKVENVIANGAAVSQKRNRVILIQNVSIIVSDRSRAAVAPEQGF